MKLIPYPIILVLVTFCSIGATPVCANQPEISLPYYRIQIDHNDLDKLYADPYSDKYYDAVFYYGDLEIPCEVRFRGATSRDLPKKSWRIRFFNDNNIFRKQIINLNAEYRDQTLLRNFLSCKLFQHLGYPAPDASFISLYVNGQYMGVYVDVEEVDEYFLERNDRISGNLYKAKNHGACMSPLTTQENYSISWDKKLGDILDYSDIQLLFNKALYWSNEDFTDHIDEEIDIDNFLTYFSIMFATMSLDNFTKNLYLYYNPASEVYELFPWDNDAAYGNDWTGEYHESYEEFGGASILNYQVIFQRLMEHEIWKHAFEEKVNRVRTEGFAYLLDLIDSTTANIRNDVYLDNEKACTGSEFDEAVEQLKTFLINRGNYLDGFTYPAKKPLYDYYCSNPFPTPDNSSVVFRAASEHSQSVYVNYITGLNFEEWGSAYQTNRLKLYDDGNHHDLEAGDLIYGNTLTLSEESHGLIPYCFVSSEFYYPQNGLFYIQYARTNSFALNCSNNRSDIMQFVEIGDIYKLNNEVIVEIRNTSPQTVDISYCHLVGDEYYLDFLIPENTVIEGNGSLMISTNKVLSEYYFENVPSAGNLYYTIAPGDSLKLLSPARTEMDAAVCENYTQLVMEDYTLVINEINYNSSDEYDPDDWIELYNPNDVPVDISNWIFRDSDKDNAFVIPYGSYIAPDNYIVLCRDSAVFHRLFPGVTNYLGDFDFRLDGAGEHIMLLNIQGGIVDSLTYDDSFPWPIEPDGSGATLSLMNPKYDNALPGSWTSSKQFGTPGAINDVFKSDEQDNNEDIPAVYSLGKNYPNPFNHKTIIPFSLPCGSNITIEIFNSVGQRVAIPFSAYKSAGDYSIVIDASHMSSGIYYYYMHAETFHKFNKMTILK